jgi:two-component system, OmpR family, response regulator
METAGCHVLVVDDDVSLCQRLGDYLQKNDFRVTAIHSGKEILELIAEEAIDLLLMGIRLPGTDGLALTRTVRESSPLPMVVLSERADEADRVMGLELGADDYITKPFSYRELLARIRALVRRRKLDVDSAAQLARNGELRAYRFAGWELNLRLLRLSSPVGDRVALSRGEFNLLRALLSAPQRVLTREQLLDLTRVHGADVYGRSIDVQVLRLRRKIEVDACRPQFIKTERGVGYYFDAEVSAIRCADGGKP